MGDADGCGGTKGEYFVAKGGVLSLVDGAESTGTATFVGDRKLIVVAHRKVG